MNIMICSAKEAAHQLRAKPHHWHVVSLRCFEDRIEFEKVSQLAHLAKTMIVRRFDDIWVEEEGKVLPTKEDVETIIRHVQEIYPSNLIVHCYAGVSRSTAIAYLLACLEKEPDDAIKMLNPMIHYPNELIVKLGSEILNNPRILEVYEREFGGDPFQSMMGQ